MSARNITMKMGEKLNITCGKGKKSRSRMKQTHQLEEDEVAEMMSSSSALKRLSSSDNYSDLDEMRDFKKNTGRFHVVTPAEWEEEKKEKKEKKK